MKKKTYGKENKKDTRDVEEIVYCDCNKPITKIPVSAECPHCGGRRTYK